MIILESILYYGTLCEYTCYEPSLRYLTWNSTSISTLSKVSEVLHRHQTPNLTPMSPWTKLFTVRLSCRIVHTPLLVVVSLRPVCHSRQCWMLRQIGIASLARPSCYAKRDPTLLLKKEDRTRQHRKKKTERKMVGENKMFARMTYKKIDRKREDQMNFVSEWSHGNGNGSAVLSRVEGHEASKITRLVHHQNNDIVVKCCVLVVLVAGVVALRRGTSWYRLVGASSNGGWSSC